MYFTQTNLGFSSLVVSLDSLPAHHLHSPNDPLDRIGYQDMTFSDHSSDGSIAPKSEAERMM